MMEPVAELPELPELMTELPGPLPKSDGRPYVVPKGEHTLELVVYQQRAAGRGFSALSSCAA